MFCKLTTVAVGLVVFLSGNLSARAQREPSQPSAGITTFPVLVVGHGNRPIIDLSQNELKVYEAKKEQPIESVTRNPASPAEIGFLIDNSKSSVSFLNRLRSMGAADLTGNLLRAGDAAFVATFSRSHTLTCPVTSDHGGVKTSFAQALQGPLSRDVTSLYDALFWASNAEFSPEPGHRALIV